MSDRGDEFGAFLVGFIVGGMAGAVVALLLAPQSGEETRALIKDKSIELRDYASQEAEEVMRKTEELAKEALARGEEITLKAKERGKEFVESAKKATGRKKDNSETSAA